MAGASFIGIFVLLFVLLVLVGFIAGVILWVTAGRTNAGGEMACGGCGYQVRGLEQLTCPECGADLRAVGINSGGSGGRRLTGILLTVICGFLMLSCVGMMAAGFLVAAAPTKQSMPLQALPAQPVTGQPANTEGDSNNVDDEGQESPPEPGSP